MCLTYVALQSKRGANAPRHSATAENSPLPASSLQPPAYAADVRAKRNYLSSACPALAVALPSGLYPLMLGALQPGLPSCLAACFVSERDHQTWYDTMWDYQIWHDT